VENSPAKELESVQSVDERLARIDYLKAEFLSTEVRPKQYRLRQTPAENTCEPKSAGNQNSDCFTNSTSPASLLTS